MTTYQQTTIWKKFSAQPDFKDFLFVEPIIEDCIPILKEFSKTFPKYTDHSGIHQINILRLIEDLLGNQLDNLTTLECAILILSTYLHDIGMVFTDNEKTVITQEARFSEFLQNNAKANRQFQEQNRELSADLAEWYCRWDHAFRVHKYLVSLELRNPNCLRYKGFSLREKLGMVCESHNWSTEEIKKNDDFTTDFLSNQADLRFCAILLRLADYLDFDDSRAPHSLFNFLELSKPSSYTEAISQREWLKHQASAGFKFPHKERDKPYEISYLAHPNEINIEQEIRHFLTGIEKELNECAKVLNFCSPRWKNYKLPYEIKKEIHSQGYRYDTETARRKNWVQEEFYIKS